MRSAGAEKLRNENSFNVAMKDLKSKHRINVKKGSLRESGSIKSIKNIFDNPIQFSWPKLESLQDSLFLTLQSQLLQLYKAKMLVIGLNKVTQCLETATGEPLMAAFACVDDVGVKALFAHLFPLGCMYRESYPEFRLLALPKGSLPLVTAKLGIKSAMAFGVYAKPSNAVYDQVKLAELAADVAKVDPLVHPYIKSFAEIPSVEFCTLRCKKRIVYR